MRSVRRAGWHHCCALTPSIFAAVPAGLEGPVDSTTPTGSTHNGQPDWAPVSPAAILGGCAVLGIGVFGARLFPGVCGGAKLHPPYHWIDIGAINQHRTNGGRKRRPAWSARDGKNDDFRRVIVEPKLTLLLKDPWNRPRTAGRVLCLFEMYSTFCDAEGPRLEGIAGRRHLKIIRSALSSSKETKAGARRLFQRKHREEDCPGI